jgi:hypothetical protein
MNCLWEIPASWIVGRLGHRHPASDLRAMRAGPVVQVVDNRSIQVEGRWSAQPNDDQLAGRREQRIRQIHPVLCGVILALTDEPQPTTAWAGAPLRNGRPGWCHRSS